MDARWERVGIVGSLGALYSLYWPLSRFTITLEAHHPELWIDRVVPLVPSTTLIYGMIWFVAMLPLFVVRDQALFRRVALAYAALEVTALTLFVVAPVHMALRPEISELEIDSLASWGLAFFYWADPPSNCFPSLHVATTVLGALCCLSADRLVGRINLGLALAIAVSTMPLLGRGDRMRAIEPIRCCRFPRTIASVIALSCAPAWLPSAR